MPLILQVLSTPSANGSLRKQQFSNNILILLDTILFSVRKWEEECVLLMGYYVNKDLVPSYLMDPRSHCIVFLCVIEISL